MAVSLDIVKEILTQHQEQFQLSQQQLLTIMTRQFNQLVILQEGKNLNSNNVENIVNTMMEFHCDMKSRKTFALW